jgi:purine-nucleoside phosphorylase
MSELINKINETLEVIRKFTSDNYPVGIILGTGLGGLVKEINIEHQIDYADLPHFPLSTVESHHGKLIFGTINGQKLLQCKVDSIITKVTRCSKLLILFV